MRLCLGLLLEDMADRFDIAKGTASKIFTTWIKVLAVELKTVFPWPSKELVVQKAPAQFKQYPNTRILIDCTEVFIASTDIFYITTRATTPCRHKSWRSNHICFRSLGRKGVRPGYNKVEFEKMVIKDDVQMHDNASGTRTRNV